MKTVNNLNLGFSDAENYLQRGNKELFNKIFIRNHFLEEILLPSRYFIIGEKGTGKTAYAVFLSNNYYNKTYSILKYIRETDYQKFLILKKNNQLDLSDYSNIWSVIILLLLAENILSQKKGLFNGKRIHTLMNAINKYYHDAFSPEIVTVLSFLEKSEVAASLISKNLEASGSLEKEKAFNESRFQINIMYILRQFKDALSSLKLSDNYTLYIDGIDIRPGGIPYPDYLECIKGLSDAVWNLNQDFFSKVRDTKGRMKVVLLLRADIFNSLSLQNLNNKLHDNSVYLDWRTTYADYASSDLFELGDRILSVQQNETNVTIKKGDHWNAYFPWSTPSTSDERKKDTSFVNFLRLSYSRPRDILSMMQLMREIMCEEGDGGQDVFLFKTFKSLKFQNSYSEYLMGGIKDQLSFYYSSDEYDAFLKFFTFLDGHYRFSYQDYVKAYKKFEQYVLKTKQNIPRFAENKDIFLQFLYDANIICYREIRDRMVYFRWCYRERGPSNISPKVLLDADEYSIHRGLFKALNVREL